MTDDHIVRLRQVGEEIQRLQDELSKIRRQERALRTQRAQITEKIDKAREQFRAAAVAAVAADVSPTTVADVSGMHRSYVYTALKEAED